MPITFTTADALPADVDVVGVPVWQGGEPAAAGPPLDAAELAAQGFEGKAGQVARLGGGVLAVGLGERDTADLHTLRRAAACFVRASWHARTAATTLTQVDVDSTGEAVTRAVAEGAGLAAYRFTAYKSDPDPSRLETFTVVGARQADLDHAVAVIEAVTLARDLVNEPAGGLTPVSLAARAEEIAAATGLQIEVLDELQCEAEGLGGISGVGRGSENPPRLVRLTHAPAGATTSVALVGKGITFDSGGLSIKPADGMMNMKDDMGGAAAVLATMSALAAVGVHVKVTGYLCLAENMPSGRAIRPGDVLKMRNGKTVEVLNTDAEGRLVLADGLSLAAEQEPDAIIDLATLTGAQVVSLGTKIAGLMGTDDALVDRLRAASARSGEQVWHLPLPPEYRKNLDSNVADIKNVSANRDAGTLIAGLFLKEFVGDIPWAHLDIAGPAFVGDDDGEIAKGGTGFGVRLLLEALSDW